MWEYPKYILTEDSFSLWNTVQCVTIYVKKNYESNLFYKHFDFNDKNNNNKKMSTTNVFMVSLFILIILKVLGFSTCILIIQIWQKFESYITVTNIIIPYVLTMDLPEFCSYNQNT